MNIAENVFAKLDGNYVPGVIGKATTYYFSIGEVKKTVTMTPTSCKVADGKASESADCVCKMDADLFYRVWFEGYEPGVRDFLAGTIRSNDIVALRKFMQACGK